MKKYINWSLLLVPFLLMSFMWGVNKKTTIWLIGDSTVCHYNSSQFPLTGWGMPFADYFDSSILIQNKARGGRSTRTFISEGLWAPIKNNLQKGDYVFIQFGHNDEAKNYPDRYTPVEDYRKNLEKFVEDSREKGAIPVLITPVSRRKFDGAGKALETHGAYSPVVREVAAKMNVPLIDLDQMSIALYQRFGPENTTLLFNLLKPGEEPNYPNGVLKNATHFNTYGARHIAELVLQGIKNAHLPLAQHMAPNR
ncbi:rhamnogalacturonan acetylesterase [Arachidicoccus sp.]|uniref:rhamnogalacturonan acetylesterase n=1 Tax=Arachidicoccus sp. TaxID=1872624 RepID=UPI003D25038D